MYILYKLRIVILLIIFYKRIQLLSAISIEVFFQILHITPYQREIEVQHLKFISIICWMLLDIQSPEQFLEVVFLIDIIIGLEHTEEKALAETAWPDKKQEVACPFHFLEIHGLVDQIFVFIPYLLKIRDAVGYQFEVVAHNGFFFSANIAFYFQTAK